MTIRGLTPEDEAQAAALGMGVLEFVRYRAALRSDYQAIISRRIAARVNRWDGILRAWMVAGSDQTTMPVEEAAA